MGDMSDGMLGMLSNSAHRPENEMSNGDLLRGFLGHRQESGKRGPAGPDAPVQLIQEVSQRDWEAIGPQAKRILLDLIPQFVEHFVAANLHYGGENADKLGPAGQFADIWRKIGPLKRALWHGEELSREQPYEILRDLIGHAFLTQDMINQGVDRRGVQS
jgi:hypothetical protein